MQEHVALLRAITVSFPAVYADLALLTSEDAEVDFFNNIAHLQLHRRGRALIRLSKVCLPLLHATAQQMSHLMTRWRD